MSGGVRGLPILITEGADRRAPPTHAVAYGVGRWRLDLGGTTTRQESQWHTVVTRERERLETEAFGVRNEREAVDGMPSDRSRLTLTRVLARYMLLHEA